MGLDISSSASAVSTRWPRYMNLCFRKTRQIRFLIDNQLEPIGFFQHILAESELKQVNFLVYLAKFSLAC